MGPGENWEPRKRDPDLIEHGLSGLDVLALLVSIYGSTDLFVNEYRSLLADKLLNNLCYNTDVEVETLELLKIRFGEEPLHSCEVMLRDIEDSKRINWKCSICRCEIKSEMSNFEIGNFLCDTCIESHGKPTEVVDDRILESSVRFREYCRDILMQQQKNYLKYIKVFERGVKK
jgi:hypothetical protein